MENKTNGMLTLANDEYVTEMCNHCQSEITMIWNVDKQGYHAFCPYCGAELMLCDECMFRTGFCDFKTDFSWENGTCRRTDSEIKERCKDD